MTVVDAAPPSPPPEGGDEEKPKPTAYYRPSRDAILRLLKAKVDTLSAQKNFNKFDHLMRSLGREGLLEPTADPALVRGKMRRSCHLTAAARCQAAIDQIAQYLPPTLLPQLIGCYE